MLYIYEFNARTVESKIEDKSIPSFFLNFMCHLLLHVSI